MSARITKAGQGTSQGAPAEWVWGGLGLGAAAASASFATYMLVFGPGPFGLHGSADFGLFAHLAPKRGALRPIQAEASNRLPEAAASRPEAAGGSADRGGGVDFSPTGSVQAEPAAGKTVPAPHQPTVSKVAPLAAFVLRDVFDGKALIESRRSLTLVAPGSMLEGAGEVLSIERRGDTWAVTTTGGVISAAVQ